MSELTSPDGHSLTSRFKATDPIAELHPAMALDPELMSCEERRDAMLYFAKKIVDGLSDEDLAALVTAPHRYFAPHGLRDLEEELRK